MNDKVTYQIENFYTLKEEVDELFQKHWEEIALFKDKMKLNPDWNYYEMLYKEGMLGLYTARKNNKLVGYFVVVAKEHPHYKDHTVAANDILFVDPDHRKGLVGYKLIKFAKENLKELGVSVLSINFKTHKPFDKILERLGFENTEKLYTVYIGD
jgi:GNAT superfamily N-acetyltransferase